MRLEAVKDTNPNLGKAVRMVLTNPVIVRGVGGRGGGQVGRELGGSVGMETLRRSSGRAGEGRLPRVHLASRSARRHELLNAAGIAHTADHPGLDDGQLSPGHVRPEEWVVALAYLKAASALRRGVGGAGEAEVVLGADTVVVKSGRVMGQARDEADAREMLRALRNGAHEVLTGVALVTAAGGARVLYMDRARVQVGQISDDQIEGYVASGEWRGKAGAYNLSERLAAGWPITFEGDPGTIMGLPVRGLAARLAALGAP